MSDESLAKEIYEKANEIIKGLKPQDFRKQAVNWGDFGCVEVYNHKSFYPFIEDEWHITLEEADPASDQVCGYISSKLKEHFCFQIFVHAEW